VAALVPASHVLPLSIGCLTAARLLPRKDYATERIVAGALQLAPGTHLLLDETALMPGTMGEPAVRNLRALAALVTTQTIEVDFVHFAKEFPVDVAVAVLSEGRTILPVRARLHICPLAHCPPSLLPGRRRGAARCRLCARGRGLRRAVAGGRAHLPRGGAAGRPADLG
jgi:hypothetical protein